MEDWEPFSRLVKAINPWTGHLVFIGGWAYRLYRFHPMARRLDYRAVYTRDTDLGFDTTAPLEGDIKSALDQNGFHEELSGEHRPPVSRYFLGEGDAGFYAEFLTPLDGRAIRSDGRSNATLERAGITAQKLRHLDILFKAPWAISLTKEHHPAFDPAVDVQIANPASFIAQKILIHDDRPANKRPQDILYIHDTLELFFPELPALNDVWINSIRPSCGEAVANKIAHRSAEVFRKLSDTIREAAEIPTDRTLVPARMQALCLEGVGRLFKT